MEGIKEEDLHDLYNEQYQLRVICGQDDELKQKIKDNLEQFILVDLRYFILIGFIAIVCLFFIFIRFFEK